jgi:type II secretory pathway pseudopilin PulG
MNKFNNENGGYILFTLLIVGACISLMAVAMLFSMQSSLKTVGTKRTNECAFNIAEAGKENALAQLRRSLVTPLANKSITIFNTTAFGKETCKGAYTVKCSSNTAIDTLWLRSTSNVGNQSVSLEVVCHRYTILSNLTFPARAAVTARSSVSTSGNMTIDGRDWDSTGASVVGSGVFGISTCRTFSEGGSSAVGGKGAAPPNKGSAAGSVQQYADSTNFPRTPEEVLGLQPGALNQYVVNTLPPMPFRGIVYLNTNGSVSLTGNGLSGSSGILIVHDSSNHSGTGTAAMDIVHGNFKGIIIADKINKLNSNDNILGAIVVLSSNAGDNLFGNGTVNIRYSSQVLNNLSKYTTGLSYSIDVISWREL